MPDCHWCDFEYGENEEGHQCTQCGEEISKETCDKYEGTCAECNFLMAKGYE